MALTQLLPSFRPNEECVDEARPVMRARAPVQTGFRSGADLMSVVDGIRGARVVCVDAAPGAGKSTRLPRFLAETTGALVVQVLPYSLLAASVYRYVARQEGASCVNIDSVETPWPDSGVVLISAACLAARWMQQGSSDMPDCYLLHDESHESGAASALLRLLGPSASGVRSYVQMTATFGPVGSRMSETGGKLEIRKYDPESFEDPWSVEEEGAPWAVADTPDHILVFEDDPKRAADLVQAYNMNGARAYRLHSRMSVQSFIAMLDDIETSSSVFALIADSSFRTGHTFPVSVVVDSGKVRRVAVNHRGDPVYVSRDIYNYESIQTGMRAARVPGTSAVYWLPMTSPLEKVMCDLEQTDVEALALMCRMMGYAVPVYARKAKMATAPLPRDVSESLRGNTPLACLRPEQCVDRQTPQRDSGYFSAVGYAEDSSRHGVASDATTACVTESAASGFLHEFVSVREVSDAEPGMYCYPVGLETTALASSFFPDGVESVLRVMETDETDTVFKYWPTFERAVAVNALVHEHNLQALQLRATYTALSEVRAMPVVGTTVSLRKWAVAMSEKLAEHASKTTAMYSQAAMLAHKFCALKNVGDVFTSEETVVRTQLVESYQALAKKDAAGKTDMVEKIRAWTNSQVDFEKEKLASKMIDGMSGVQVSYTPVVNVRGFSGYPRVTMGKVSTVNPKSMGMLNSGSRYAFSRKSGKG